MTQRTLLIVDDEPDLCEIMVDLLSAEGFLCFSAISAAKALELMAEFVGQGRKVDLIISDLNMPGGSGIDLLKQLRRKEIKTPFFFLTGDISDAELRPYFDQGVLGYQLKPFQIDEFMKKIKGLVESLN